MDFSKNPKIKYIWYSLLFLGTWNFIIVICYHCIAAAVIMLISNGQRGGKFHLEINFVVRACIVHQCPSCWRIQGVQLGPYPSDYQSNLLILTTSGVCRNITFYSAVLACLLLNPDYFFNKVSFTDLLLFYFWSHEFLLETFKVENKNQIFGLSKWYIFLI